MKRLNFSLLQIKVVYIITTVFLALLSIYAFLQIKNLVESSDSVNHTNQVTLSLLEISAAITEAETSQRGFLLTGDSIMLKKRDIAVDLLMSELQIVDSLVTDNPVQIQNLAILHGMINEKLEVMKKVVTAYIPLQTTGTFKVSVFEGIQKMNAVKQRLRQMSAEETRLLALRTHKYSKLSFITPLFIVLLFLGALLILLLTYFRIINALRYSEEIQEKLKQEKSLAETILNSSVDNIYVLDKDLRVIEVNKKEEEINGVKRAEHIGKKLIDIFPQAKDATPHQNLLKALQGEAIVDGEYHSSVTGRFYQTIYTPLKTRDEITGVITIAHDITNLLETTEQLRAVNQLLVKQNESLSESERFNRTLTNVSPNVVYIYDIQQAKTIFLNRTGLKTIGYDFAKANEPGNAVRDMVMHPEDIPATAEMLQKIITSEDGEVFELEYRIKNTANEWTPFLARHSVFRRNTDNTVAQIIGIAVDITERKKATDILEQKNSDLEKMNSELQSFAYVSSHDLQEPLRKIQLFASMILERGGEDHLSEKDKYYLARMQEAGKRMQQLIEDLLAYSRTNNTERNFENTDLSVIVEEVRLILLDEIAQKNASIETGKLCKAAIIPFQFRQLMLNLVSNSLKFSRAGVQPKIIIESRIEKGSELQNPKLNPDKEYCHISIIDNGMGFEPQYSERIFEIFQRLHGREKYAGTGIGLAIVKKIVENHHGIITASGAPDKGARFDIYIPGAEV